jgi:hypothetical protein
MNIGSHFPAIDLNTVTSGWNLQKRKDAKYIIEIDALTQLFVDTEVELSQLEIAGKRNFEYSTQYFDTQDLASYTMHLAGKRKRFKVRHRHYKDTNLDRFEVKTKVPRSQTHKYILESHTDFDSKGRDFVAHSLVAAYGDEYLTEVDLDLRPVAQMTFTRSTLVLTHSLDRITIDTGLKSKFEGRELNLRDDFCILELKSEEVRSALHTDLLKLSARPRKLSKYMVTVDALNADRPRAITERDLARYFVRN